MYDFFYDLPNRIISKEFDNQLQLFEGLILIFCGTHSTAGIKKTETKMQRVIHWRMSKWYLWVSFLSDPSPILVWDVPNWLTDWFMLLTLEWCDSGWWRWLLSQPVLIDYLTRPNLVSCLKLKFARYFVFEVFFFIQNLMCGRDLVTLGRALKPWIFCAIGNVSYFSVFFSFLWFHNLAV